MRRMVLLLCVAFFSGCQSSNKEMVVKETDPVLNKIARLAEVIAKENSKLAALESAKYNNLEGLASDQELHLLPELVKVVSLGDTYNGSMENFVRVLSHQAGINEPRILNLKPSSDIIVSIDADYRRVYDIMLDVISQSGTRAQITYKVAENLIEIEYTPY